MFITKKKLEALLKEREQKVVSHYEEREYNRNKERWFSDRFDSIEKELYQLRERMDVHEGIKKKYNAECTCAPTIGY